jgi:hypothetical protein
LSVEFAEIAICECCAVVAANGDSSGCDFTCEGSHTPLSKEDGNVIVASSEEYEPWFSWTSCDTCDGNTGGTRHKAYVEIPATV